MRERIEKKEMEEELNGKKEMDGKGTEERVTEIMGREALKRSQITRVDKNNRKDVLIVYKY